MIAVVADTGPINYLLLIEEVHILENFFDLIIIPEEVHQELLSVEAPHLVSAWAERPPTWCQIRQIGITERAEFQGLGLGERSAIELAIKIGSDLLMDDAEGREVAQRLGLRITGTLGLLRRAANNGLLDFDQALSRLLVTNFRISRAMLQQIREQG